MVGRAAAVGSFSSYYTNSDNNAMQSMVLPLKEIKPESGRGRDQGYESGNRPHAKRACWVGGNNRTISRGVVQP